MDTAYMPGYRRALYRLEKAMPSGMAFFGFLMIVFGIVGVITTSSEITDQQTSTDNRSQAAEPSNSLPNPPEGCWYRPNYCFEPNCQTSFELFCPQDPTVVVSPRSDGVINWQQADVALTADALRIQLADGRVFTTRDVPVQLSSDPINIDSPNYTTLEATWLENDVEMRLYIYLYRTPGTYQWYTDQIRVYNGNSPGDWIHFNQSPTGTSGQYVFNAPLNSPYTHQGTTTLTSTDPVEAATLSFTNLNLQPFLRKPPYCDELGQRPADVSGDEHVDILDVTSMTSQFFETGELDSDLTCDGVVDLRDYTILVNQLQL